MHDMNLSLHKKEPLSAAPAGEETLSADMPAAEGADKPKRFGFGKKPGLKKQGKRKRWVRLLAVLVILAVGAAAAFRMLGSQNAVVDTSYQESAVEVRSITNSLSSSGTLQPADSYTVTTLVSGEILSDTFEKGDTVEKGELLYTLDSSSASSNLTQSQNSCSQAQSSYEQAVAAKYPTADMSGTVSEVYVSNGDTVSAGTELLKIVEDDSLTIDFKFAYVNDGTFYVGQSATVYVDGFAGTLSGVVTAVSDDSTAVSTGVKLSTVRVKVTNPGLVGRRQHFQR